MLEPVNTLATQYLGASKLNAEQALRLKSKLQAKLAEAERQIDGVRSALAQRVAAVKRRSRMRGYLNGLQEAKQKAGQQLVEIQKRYHDLLNSANQDCLEIALSVAHQVIGATMHSEKNSLASRISRAINSLIERSAVKITVNPLDAESIAKTMHANFANLKVDIQTSNAIERGDARLETSAGSLELKWEEHFQIIKEKLRAQLSLRSTDHA